MKNKDIINMENLKKQLDQMDKISRDEQLMTLWYFINDHFPGRWPDDKNTIRIAINLLAEFYNLYALNMISGDLMCPALKR